MCCLGHKTIKSAAKWMKQYHGERCAKIKFMEDVTRGELQGTVKEKAKTVEKRKKKAQAKFNKKLAMQKQQDEACCSAIAQHKEWLVKESVKESLMIQDVQAEDS